MPMKGGNFHINKALSNVGTKYRNAMMIADKVFKKQKVAKESDLYYIWQRDFRLPSSGRANGAPANMEAWGVTTGNYSCAEQALAEVLTDRDFQNTDSGIDLKADTVEFLADKLAMTLEKTVADLIFTTTAAGNNLTGTTATSWRYNTTTSSPIEDINSASAVVVQASGVHPNVLVMGEQVYTGLRNNQNVYNRIQYVERAILTEQLLASLFDLDEMLVGFSIYDASQESIPTAVESITAIWGNDAYLYYRNPSTGRKKLTTGLILESRGFQVKTWREEKLAGQVVEASHIYTVKLVATQTAFYFKTIGLV